MCDPATLTALAATAASHAAGVATVAEIMAPTLSTALTIGSTAAGIGGSILSYEQQKAMSSATASAAKRAFEQDNRAITQRQLQEQTASADRKFANAQEYAAARASGVVAAGEAGVSGLSVDALLNDLAGQQAARQKTADTNLGWTLAQLQQERFGAQAQRDNRINSAPKPSSLGLALQIGGQAIGGYDTYKSRTDPSWSAPRRG